MRQFSSAASAIAGILSITSAALLSACGGASPTASSASQASVPQSFSLQVSADASTPSTVAPTFHLAPAVLDEPEDIDRTEPMTSASREPRSAAVLPQLAQLTTRGLTQQVIHEVLETGTTDASAYADGTAAKPMASSSSVTVYTPAQIRAAYALPTLPNTTASVTSAQAAQMGAGQTIYLIDAQDDPNSAAELANFNSKFGLPTCKTAPIASTASLPLAPAPATGCTFSVVYSTTSATLSATAPAYNSGWATEIAIDVQWAHATAPYARIIVIEAPDASVTSLVAAVQLANKMGPGVVSQSFGAPEGNWTSSFDPTTYGTANMTYLAAAGDGGAEVEWPAVSSHVIAVAGTSLSYSGSGSRSETVWTNSGGGVSAYVPTPTYQTLGVPGLGSLKNRAVSDVTFNANPYTGQYLAVIAQGSTNVGWYSAGGTSLATPQWAGIIAIANALRAQSALAPLGTAQPALYGLATATPSYAQNFLDVTQGSDGTCSVCSAGVGYDVPSGLGSPNVTSLLTALGAQPTAVAPVVNAATVTGKVGTALSFAISATGQHALTYALTGAPSGMTVNAATGIVTWNTPIAGTYSITALAHDATTGLTGQASIGVTVSAPQPPQVTGGSISGSTQTALLFTVQVSDANAVTYSLAGAPAGMAVSTAGVVSWASPLSGTYNVTAIAHDATTGLSGQALYVVTITPPKAPVVPPASIAGTVGKALGFNVNATDANPMTYAVTGAPAGMSIVASTGAISWPSPVLGTYSVTVIAKDTKTGLSGQGTYTVSITPTGPTIAATSLTGVAGKALTGSIAFSDSAGTVLSILITGAPSGMTFTASGNTLVAHWASPVTGTYSLRVTVIDNKSLTGIATIPVTITAT